MMLNLGFIVLSLAWLMPGHYVPWMSFQSEFVAALGAVLIASDVVRRRVMPSVSYLAMLCFGVAIVPLVQLFAGQLFYHSDAILAAGYVVGFGLSMVVAATLVRANTAAFMDGLTACLVAAAVLSSGIALAQWLGVGKDLFVAEMAPGGRPYANLGQPNHLATLLALGIVGLLRWFETRRISRLPLILGTAWLGFGLVMTQSRTGWLTAIVLGTLYAVNVGRSHLRLSLIGIVGGLGAFAVGVKVWQPLNHALLISYATSLDTRMKSDVRLENWRMLWDGLSSSPWIGYGWTQVSMAQRAAADSHQTTSELLFYSHNFFLDLLIWNGIPIGIVVIAALIWWYVVQIRACRSADQSTLLAGITAIFIHGMVEYPLSYTYFLLPAGLMMGASDGLNENGRTWSWPRMAFVAPFSVCAALLVFTGYEYIKVEEGARTARLVSAHIGVDKVSFAPVPDVWLIDGQREYIRFIGAQAKPGMTPEELAWMRKLTGRYTFAPAMYRFASAAALNGHPDEARAVLYTLCKIHGPISCDEARAGWAELQQTYPQLSSVPFPAQ